MALADAFTQCSLQWYLFEQFVSSTWTQRINNKYIQPLSSWQRLNGVALDNWWIGQVRWMNRTCVGFFAVLLKYDSSVGLCSTRTLTFSFTPKAAASGVATVLMPEQKHINNSVGSKKHQLLFKTLIIQRLYFSFRKCWEHLWCGVIACLMQSRSITDQFQSRWWSNDIKYPLPEFYSLKTIYKCLHKQPVDEWHFPLTSS